MFNLNAKAEYNEVADKYSPNFAVNHRNVDNKFGIAASLSVEQRNARQDQYFTRSWWPFLLSDIGASEIVSEDALWAEGKKDSSFQNIANLGHDTGWHLMSLVCELTEVRACRCDIKLPISSVRRHGYHDRYHLFQFHQRANLPSKLV